VISKGALFQNEAGSTFRVLHVDTELPDTVHVLGMDERKALPRQWRWSKLKAGLQDRTYKRVSANERPVVIDSRADANAIESPTQRLAKQRWELIEPLVKSQRIYRRSARGPLVAARAKETQSSEQTIMTCLRLYWRGGMTRDALVPSFHKCGITTNTHNGAVRGARPTRRLYPKYRITPDEETRILKIAGRTHKKGKTKTLYAIYRAVIRALYSIVDANGELVQRPLGERPTYAQVIYRLRKTLTLEAILRRKHGDDGFENNVQPKTGSARLYAGGVAQYFEIDSTIPDVWVCAEDDRSVVIGKATLYLIVDRFSRLIVGFHLTLDSPSWSGAMEAMLSLVQDKKQLCERWGFDYREEDWVAHGAWPAMFVADRGPEFVCHASDSVADGVEGGLVNVPRRRAPRKGTIECTFKLVHVPLKDHVGGYTPPADAAKRQTDDQRATATRTLRSIGNEVLHAIRFHNHRVHRGIELPPKDVYAGWQPIPSEIWRRDVDRAGLLASFSEDYLRFKLLPKATANVRPDGIEFDGLLYEADKRDAPDMLLRATRKTYEVSVTYDRRLVDAIYVHDKKDPTRWMTVHLQAKHAHYAGLSWPEYTNIKTARMHLDDAASEKNLTMGIRYDAAAESREKTAQVIAKAVRAAKAGQRSSRTAKELRATEVKRGHLRTPVLPSTVVAEAAPASSTTARADSTVPTSENNSAVAHTTVNAALQALLALRKKS
jgi:putative transposase